MIIIRESSVDKVRFLQKAEAFFIFLSSQTPRFLIG